MTQHSILLIEWGEKFARFAKERDVEIAIEHGGANRRAVKVNTERPPDPLQIDV